MSINSSQGYIPYVDYSREYVPHESNNMTLISPMTVPSLPAPHHENRMSIASGSPSYPSVPQHLMNRTVGCDYSYANPYVRTSSNNQANQSVNNQNSNETNRESNSPTRTSTSLYSPNHVLNQKPTYIMNTNVITSTGTTGPAVGLTHSNSSKLVTHV